VSAFNSLLQLDCIFNLHTACMTIHFGNKRTETGKLPPHLMRMASINTKDNCILSWSRHTSRCAQLFLPQALPHIAKKYTNGSVYLCDDTIPAFTSIFTNILKTRWKNACYKEEHRSFSSL